MESYEDLAEIPGFWAAMEVILDPKQTVDFNNIDICNMKIATKYCVDDDTHLKQVKATMARNLPSLPITMETTYDPIAVACSGPSLNRSWEELRKFSKIISCSGTHDFLIERGIIPTYQMETDPRKHKSMFVTKPHPEVKYFIASCCHPAVFDALEGAQVYIWHVLSSKDSDEIYRDGDWILTGGSNVGLRVSNLLNVRCGCLVRLRTTSAASTTLWTRSPRRAAWAWWRNTND